MGLKTYAVLIRAPRSNDPWLEVVTDIPTQLRAAQYATEYEEQGFQAKYVLEVEK